jgi:hypothetical protein
MRASTAAAARGLSAFDVIEDRVAVGLREEGPFHLHTLSLFNLA